ncbi:hypothetical protein SanaruYs_36870 [Chryseotalea sanaruensis]|uniref:Uncharacterized protein n=1 Tax=Chryseotalea sanaruensis TaxID=2482724 RepID=A0A401UEX2_9BACT|nr:hypothetical protein [Chryseotalea sanaruensis]GCC53443.1 hypothetical protein SanaruYs_36870 [Chryseotalea sanaruensis]
MGARVQESKLLDIRTATELILGGRVLVISGDENLLERLPKGNWIGGTIPYFYLKNECGRMDKSKVFVTDFTESINDFKILTLDEETLSSICLTGFDNGFNFLILPALQSIHYNFALNVRHYEDLYKNPLIGLVAGTSLEENKNLSKTFNGYLKESSTTQAVVLQCSLLPSKVARIEIVNVFEQSDDFYIEVFEDTFKVKDCLINGDWINLYQFIKDKEVDISYPLICDYSGASVNVSFQLLVNETKEVVFYAPLFKNKRYYFSKKLDSYQQSFQAKIAEVLERETLIIYNCNSILNYLFGELHKNDIGFSGATTFGEIAYCLLNQTFTYLAIDE